MRLTLRTLLAYLDDRLPPANAKELGQKIAKSPFATELAERIREVKRRRRLAMPDKPIVMIDANLVAEYLDDQLTPELVARIEQEILASDMMLAEVASAHEILGQLRDPVTVEPRLRDRLYALDPTGSTDIVRALAAGNSFDSKTTATRNNEWKPLEVPESSRRVPIIIVAGLAMIWLATVMSDSVLFESADTAQNVVDAVGNGEVPENAADNGVQLDVPEVADHQAVIAADDGSLEPEVASVDDNTTVKADMSQAAVAPDSTPVADSSQPPKTDASAIAVAAVATAPGGAVVPAPAAVVVPGEVKPKPVDAAAAEKLSVNIMTDNRTLFVFDETAGRWVPLGKIPGGENVIRIRNVINCLPLLEGRWFTFAAPFHGTIFTADRGWSATTFGNTLTKIIAGPVAGLNIWSGRFKLAVDATQPWVEDALPVFALKAAGVESLLTLQSKDAVVGIEVIPVSIPSQEYRSETADPKSADFLLHLPGADFQVTVTVITGQASVQLPGSEQPAVLTTGKGLSWLAPGSADGAPASAAAENIALNDGSQIAAVPEWLHEQAQPVPEVEALSGLVAESLANGEDPALAVTHLLADRNPQVGVRAVQVLTSTRDVDRLLSAMFEKLDEAVHRAAIDGLSQIAIGSLAGRSAIQGALETRIPMSEVDVTVLLIAGIGDAEARDPDFCRTLIELLNSDRLATRTLAFYRIQKYSNDRLGYQPDAESSRRREAVRRWQKLLDRNGGKLLP